MLWRVTCGLWATICPPLWQEYSCVEVYHDIIFHRNTNMNKNKTCCLLLRRITRILKNYEALSTKPKKNICKSNKIFVPTDLDWHFLLHLITAFHKNALSVTEYQHTFLEIFQNWQYKSDLLHLPDKKGTFNDFILSCLYSSLMYSCHIATHDRKYDCCSVGKTWKLLGTLQVLSRETAAW